MLQQLFNKLTQYEQVAGLTLNSGQPGNYVILKNEKGAVSIADKGEFSTIEELEEKLEKDTPLCLNISGSGILRKKLDGTGFSIDQLFTETLQSADKENFTLDSFEGSNTTWTAICRKEMLEKQAKELADRGYYVVQISLETMDVMRLAEALFSSQANTKIGAYSFRFEEDKLASIEPLEEAEHAVSIDDIEIQGRYLHAFASAFTFLLGINDPYGQIASVANNQEEIKHKLFFGKAIKVALGTLFALLMINLVIFSTARSKNETLKRQIAANATVLTQLDKLKTETEQKEAFLEKAGWFSGSKTSYYADRIAQEMPKGIALSRLEIHPEENSMAGSKSETTYKQYSIIIEGECSNSVILNEWKNILSKYDWVLNASLENYEDNPKTKSASFTLKLYK